MCGTACAGTSGPSSGSGEIAWRSPTFDATMGGVDDDTAEPAFDGLFDADYLHFYTGVLTDERSDSDAELIRALLDLKPGMAVLDLACGHGRITLELARRGYRMTGLDLSPRSLELAREAAEREELAIDWVRADMREIPTGSEFDAVVSVFTSFGYFEQEQDNQRVLQGVERALAPGGSFLIDVVNLLGLARRYQERRWSEEHGVLFLEEFEFDVLRGRNRARWTLVKQDGARGELVHSLRTYAPHELMAMLERAGLELEGSWGGFDGSELSLDSWRLILLARKP